MVDISYRNSLILNNHQFERQPSLRGLIDDSYSDNALALRWRRLISLDIAEIMNCAVLSPSSLNFSIESTSSCGTRVSNFFDFAFTAFVAIPAPISSWWLAPCFVQEVKTATPRSALTLSRRLTTTLSELMLWLIHSLTKLALNLYS
ncbi:hypothetical protein SAMN05421579_1485 [Xenorhabdus japonica]|uniref:Uncharacterized protein n=1 Tax=Xenorhabdus japonica TaxID=53341 RepID=A0A1I5DX71_9GAMM|nr:hypothetical protein SAMN05421579_1485 [Xenorhabdus japonica]